MGADCELSSSFHCHVLPSGLVIENGIISFVPLGLAAVRGGSMSERRDMFGWLWGPPNPAPN